MKQLSLALFLCLTGVSALYADTLQGTVVGISDGDTITVLDGGKVQHKIRLAGIDAPEKSQAFGDRSKQHLSNLVFGKAVTVDWNKTDRYGRTIGKVIVNGLDANLSQVQAGLAWHYKKYEKEQLPADRSIYAQAEIDARAQQVGLWRDRSPIAPWDFRHHTGDSSANQADSLSGPCACAGNLHCVGPRGGVYCVTPGGKKRYL